MKLLAAAYLALLLCLLSSAQAKRHGARQAAAPSATLRDGSVIVGSSDGKLLGWRGVRYAAAPVGTLRFAPPQDPPSPARGPPAYNGSYYSGVQTRRNATASKRDVIDVRSALAGGGLWQRRKLPIDIPGTGSGETSSSSDTTPTSTESTATSTPSGSLNAGASSDAGATTANSSAVTTTTATTSGSDAGATSAPAPKATLQATNYGPMCPQAGSDIRSMNEDCLFANINRPADVPRDTLLPVMLFFHGGGQESGSGNIDYTDFIRTSSDAGMPVMTVSINYRLNLLGFLTGSEFASLRSKEPHANVAWNLAYQDGRQATRWVRNEIRAFGGDPSKITIWGQSAGSFMVGAQLLGHPGLPLTAGENATASNATTRPLFHGAILQSGTPSGIPIANVTAKDAQYQRVLANTGCNTQKAATGKSLARTHLDCLRSIDWRTLRAVHLAESTRARDPASFVLGAYAWSASADGGPGETHNNVTGFYSGIPSLALNAGNFADVPLIAGNNQDEGTIFAQQTIFTDAQLSNWIRNSFFLQGQQSSTNTLWNRILAAYPDDPTQGSPFHPRGTDLHDRFFGGKLLHRPLPGNILN